MLLEENHRPSPQSTWSNGGSNADLKVVQESKPTPWDLGFGEIRHQSPEGLVAQSRQVKVRIDAGRGIAEVHILLPRTGGETVGDVVGEHAAHGVRGYVYEESVVAVAAGEELEGPAWSISHYHRTRQHRHAQVCDVGDDYGQECAFGDCLLWVL